MEEMVREWQVAQALIGQGMSGQYGISQGQLKGLAPVFEVKTLPEDDVLQVFCGNVASDQVAQVLRRCEFVVVAVYPQFVEIAMHDDYAQRLRCVA